MANSKSKNKPAVRKPAAKKTPAISKAAAKKAAESLAEAKANQPQVVAPLDPQAFQFALAVIDKAPFTGAEAGNVLMLKRELARVAGLQPAPA